MTSSLPASDAPLRLTRAERDVLRPLCDADPWTFAWCVAPQLRGGVERFHKVLLYLFAGPRAAHLLARALDHPDCQSELTTRLKADLVSKGVNWRTASGLGRLRGYLRRVNARLARSLGKSIYADLADLWNGSVDPDISIGIASKSDPAAQKHLAVIANIIRGPEYQWFYYDRIRPKNPELWINQDWIRLWGRTNPDEHTFLAQGINASWTSHHFTRIRTDDIIGSESGDASQDDALRFIANIPSIGRREGLGGFDHLAIGTVYGPNDDYAALERATMDGSDKRSQRIYITVNVPIWLKKCDPSIANVMVDGVPVLPEWATLEQIRIERATVLADPKQGAIAWLQNAELTAHQEGVVMLTRAIVARQTFRWVAHPRHPNDLRRRLIERPVRVQKENGEWIDVLDDKGVPKVVRYDPYDLPRMMGMDPAYSVNPWANKWALSVIAIDPYGHKIQLGTVRGLGKSALLAALPIVWNRWTLDGQFPIRKVGMDTSANQGWAADLLQREDSLRMIAHRLEKMPAGDVAKHARIYQFVGAPAEMGEFWFAPEADNPVIAEGLFYRPGEDDQEDDALDATAMGAALHRAPAAVADDVTAREIDDIERHWGESHDAATWIDTEVFLEEAAW